ncbi:MAG TPA: hypothetical protein VMO17_17280 [Terriglobia bacterium]|nr:hypothetical protein [Terriglobia bacterium]
MRPHRLLMLFLAIQFCAVLSAFGQGNYKAEAIGAAPSDIPAAIQTTLDSKGVRVTSDQGATLCEIWLRKTLSTSANPNTSSDVLFGALTEGAMVGVLHFPKDVPDFRGQNIKAGYYTLRYVLIPQDGNHMGVNPSRDAFALAPVAADKDPDKTLSFDDVVKLSRQASGTPHPGFLVGAQVNGDTFPAIAKDDSGHWNVQMKGQGKSGDLPLAMTVVGKWEG